MSGCPSCGMPTSHDGPCPQTPGFLSDHKGVLQDRYEVVGLLGQGGMGTVYMARDLRLHNRPCVVKKLRDDFYHEEDKQKAIAFFEREAGVLSALQHPNIVHILDYFEENQHYFLVMEYVEGNDLHNEIKNRGYPFPEKEVLSWAREICGVLEYLHQHQPPVIYRDLKPSNVMIDTSGRVKLVDFGIARPFEDSGDHTHVVSAGYSPPEQYWGGADPRSDIYALGATLYYLLTAKEPFALHVCSPAEQVPEISEDTDKLVRRQTAQDPDDRFQSASQLMLEIDRLLESGGQTETAGRFGRPKVIEIAVVGLFVVLAAGALLLYQRVEQVMVSSQEKLHESQEAIDEQSRNYHEMQKTIKQYERAMQAEQDALTDWQKDADTDLTRIQDETRLKAKTALTMSEEGDLTDPEGLIEPENEATGKQGRPIGFSLFGN